MNKILVYKYREDTFKMVEVGVLAENNEVILNLPYSLTLKEVEISLYDTEFYIKAVEGTTYQYIFPSNKKEIQQITTGAEGQCYSVGYMKNGVVIFYDQYLKE